LLTEGRPLEVGAAANTRALKGTSMPSFSAPASLELGRGSRGPISPALHQRLMRRAAVAQARGNDVGAAMLAARAAAAEDPALEKAAEARSKEALISLGRRLNNALRGEGPKGRLPDWPALLRLLAERAAHERASGYSVEGRLLFELQRAAVAWEKPQGVVDLASWMSSWGKLPVVRTLPATRELRVARYLRAAANKVRYVRLSGPDRKLLAKLLATTTERAAHNVRHALKPRLDRAFDEVGLVARSGPERLGREKVIEELLDHIFERGYLSLDNLRDAVSRNQLKLDDLSGAGELYRGDALLRADAKLHLELDGIYRRGDVYLRGLQKLSSVPFGTRIGRAVTLYAALPLGASFVTLEGLGHIVSPLAQAMGFPAVHLLGLTSFIVTALVFFALLHSRGFRSFAGQVLDLVALVLATIFLRLPRALFQRPAFRRLLQKPWVRFLLRRVLFPGFLGGVAYAMTATEPTAPKWLPAAVGGGVFVVSSFVMGSPIGAWLEDFVVDQLAPTWQVLSRQWLPGLFRLIARFFATMMELIQRAMFKVDEVLRFQEGQSAPTLFVKGAGRLVWGIVAYVVRFYVTLMIEPEINPLKHFPVVTVAHKLLIPFLGDLQTLLAPIEDLVPVVGVAVVWVTIFLLPSVFGFLAWELKENYKLYRATRPEMLPAAPVGPHGETMRGLLVAGLHSGTLPKLYERLRRAAQREDEAEVMSFRRLDKEGGLTSDGLGRFRAGLREVEQSVSRFVERELVALLERCPRWTFGDVAVEAVDLSSNRVRVQLSCAALGPDPLAVTFEEQSGLVVAGVDAPGFLGALDGHSPVAKRLFENALAGVYHRAEVDIVREQLEGELDAGSHYDISDDGLVVWPGVDYATELVYRIDGGSQGAVAPEIRGLAPEGPARVLDTRRLFYNQQPIAWLSWVAAWNAAEHESVDVPRLVLGASILPGAAAPTTGATDGAGPSRPPILAPTPTTVPPAMTADTPSNTVVMESPSEDPPTARLP
ncbi:MAG: hypothetical protein KC731_14585, partial [Myxococcales bacterium]|nr:hypothetical protein [Myxococcales bacterium]